MRWAAQRARLQALGCADDYTSEARIRAVYYAEVESLLRSVTGAQKVLVFDHTLRDGTPVVVKVRRPGVVNRINGDLEILQKGKGTLTNNQR